MFPTEGSMPSRSTAASTASPSSSMTVQDSPQSELKRISLCMGGKRAPWLTPDDTRRALRRMGSGPRRSADPRGRQRGVSLSLLFDEKLLSADRHRSGLLPQQRPHQLGGPDRRSETERHRQHGLILPCRRKLDLIENDIDHLPLSVALPRHGHAAVAAGLTEPREKPFGPLCGRQPHGVSRDIDRLLQWLLSGTEPSHGQETEPRRSGGSHPRLGNLRNDPIAGLS